MTAGVQLTGVCRAFGDVRAVDHVDLTVPAGSIVALLGPSGCGKTTTLRLIAGFEAPDGGEVRIGGRLAARPGTRVPPERRRVGMVFQQLALFPHLDVAGNVGYGLRGERRAGLRGERRAGLRGERRAGLRGERRAGLRGERRAGLRGERRAERWTRGHRRERVAAMLELVGLAGYERRFPDQLSGGQAQRVALARALAPGPDVVLLDEPFSSLDVSLRAGVRREVRGILKAAGATALLVTHDQDEALAMGDQVAVMLDGRIVQAGPPEEVYRRPATPAVAEFLGDANLVEGVVRDGRLDTEIGVLDLVAGERDGQACGLVRPEDLDLDEAPDGPGRVIDVEYYGHDQLITVALPSGRVLRARLHARRRFPEGSRVRLRVGGLGVVAFPLALPLPDREPAAH